ncbi:MAG: hypothetical protein ACR2QE_12145 [Acidimicrobiales bacterium]
MTSSHTLRTALVTALFVLGACSSGGSDTDQATSEGAGRAIPDAISDLQADCDRGAPGSCEALSERLDEDLSAADVNSLVCGSWGELQLNEGDSATAAARIAELAGDELPAEVKAALDTMASGTGDEVDAARDVIDEHFLTAC